MSLSERISCFSLQVICVLTIAIYPNLPSGNLLHKHETIKFDMVGERPGT